MLTNKFRILLKSKQLFLIVITTTLLFHHTAEADTNCARSANCPQCCLDKLGRDLTNCTAVYGGFAEWMNYLAKEKAYYDCIRKVISERLCAREKQELDDAMRAFLAVQEQKPDLEACVNNQFQTYLNCYNSCRIIRDGIREPFRPQ